MSEIFQLEGIDDHPYDVEYDNAKYGPRIKSALKLAYPFPKCKNNYQMVPLTKERYIHNPFLIEDDNSE